MSTTLKHWRNMVRLTPLRHVWCHTHQWKHIALFIFRPDIVEILISLNQWCSTQQKLLSVRIDQEGLLFKFLYHLRKLMFIWFKHILFRRKGLGAAYTATMPSLLMLVWTDLLNMNWAPGNRTCHSALTPGTCALNAHTGILRKYIYPDSLGMQEGTSLLPPGYCGSQMLT